MRFFGRDLLGLQELGGFLRVGCHEAEDRHWEDLVLLEVGALRVSLILLVVLFEVRTVVVRVISNYLFLNFISILFYFRFVYLFFEFLSNISIQFVSFYYTLSGVFRHLEFANVLHYQVPQLSKPWVVLILEIALRPIARVQELRAPPTGLPVPLELEEVALHLHAALDVDLHFFHESEAGLVVEGLEASEGDREVLEFHFKELEEVGEVQFELLWRFLQ